MQNILSSGSKIIKIDESGFNIKCGQLCYSQGTRNLSLISSIDRNKFICLMIIEGEIKSQDFV